jgi:hypothetical protein
MLADPRSWYERLPGAVPDFGPLNEHFVRDIGSIFTLLGVALIIGGRWPRTRVAVLWGAGGFTWLHAAVHIFDTARGLVGPSHWMLDVLPIYAPAVVLAIALRAAIRATKPQVT